MNKKRKAALQVGKPNAALEKSGFNNRIYILRTRNHVVKLDADQFAFVIENVLGGLLFAAVVVVFSVIIPVMFGGY